MAHAYSGERFVCYENFAESKILRQHVYGAEGFPNYSYNCSPEYTFLKESDDVDDIVTRLLYILHTGISPEAVGFNTEYLKMIPHLTKCKLLREESGKPAVNIPVLNESEYEILHGLLTDAKEALWEDLSLRMDFRAFLADKKMPIPVHLDGVPLHKQYLYAMHAMEFATIRLAMTKGELYDGNYDDDSVAVNQHPCPMLLVIE